MAAGAARRRARAEVQFGEYGLLALEPSLDHEPPDRGSPYRDDPPHRRGGKVWINVFPQLPGRAEASQTRMGSGKGSPEGWVAVVKPGGVGSSWPACLSRSPREALRLAGQKLPLKTKFVQP